MKEELNKYKSLVNHIEELCDSECEPFKRLKFLSEISAKIKQLKSERTDGN